MAVIINGGAGVDAAFKEWLEDAIVAVPSASNLVSQFDLSGFVPEPLSDGLFARQVLSSAGSWIGATAIGADLWAAATTNAALATLEPVVTATVAANYTIDAADGSVFVLTLTGNHQLSFSNLAAGRVITVHIIQDGTGNRVPTWSGVTWGATGEPTLLTGAGDRDKLSFDSYNGGIIDGHLIEQYEA